MSKNKLLRYISLFLIVLLNIQSAGGALEFENISIEQGLSQSIVITITQDSYGFLWIGTENGLNRYDGYNFKHFKHDKSNPNSISNNYVRSIVEDKNKCLWIATNSGGLNSYNLLTEKFETYKNIENDSNSISGDYLTSLVPDEKDNLWIGTIYSGLNYFDQRSGKFTRFGVNASDKNSIPSQHITSLEYDLEQKLLWIGTYNGLAVMNIQSGKITLLNKALFRKSNPENKRIRSLLLDSKKNIWVGSDAEGLFKLSNINSTDNFAAIKVQQYKNSLSDNSSISGNSINAIIETKKGEILLGIWGGGVNRLIDDKGKCAFEVYVSKKDYTRSLNMSGNDVDALYEDDSGVLWIGTYGYGLNKVSPYAGNFKHHSHDPSDKYSLTDDRVFSIYKDSDKNMWIGTWGGLNYFDQKNGRYIDYGNKNSSTDKDRIISIIEDNDKRLWIATLDNGLIRLDKKTRQFKYYSYGDGNNLPTSRLLSLLKRKDGSIWIGTFHEGVYIYDSNTDSFTPFEGNSGMADKRIKYMFEERDNIWLGTYTDLYKFNLKKGVIEEFLEDNDHNVFSSGVTVINKFDNGAIWVGTYGNGLVKLSKSDDEKYYTVKEYHGNDGLPNEFINSVIPDEYGNTWISTKEGIVRLDLLTDRFFHYGFYEGLTLREYNEGFFYDKDESKIYMGSLDGYIEFDLRNLSVDYPKPKLVFTELKLFNKTVSAGENSPIDKSITGLAELVFDYNENSISLEFAALNYISPKTTKYTYKLEGFDKEYFTASSFNREITYTNLPTGEYSLKVRAYLGGQHESYSEKNLLINIVPPFWATTWFRIVAGVVFISLIFGGFRWRTIAYRKRNIELSEVVALRTKELEDINVAKDKFFSVIAHDLKGPFSYLLNNSDLLLSDLDNLPKEDINSLARNINGSANKLYNLLENLLEWSRYQMMGIRPKKSPVNLNELVENNIILYKHLADNKKITFDNLTESTYIINSDSNILNTIIRNLFINAIKFSNEGGSVGIKIEKVDQWIRLQVKDSGVGMDEATIDKVYSSKQITSTNGTKNESGTGLGLVMIREFMESLGGKLNIESVIGKGTSIQCYLPE